MEQVVYRQCAFPVSAFDYLKDWQRAYRARHGVTLTNSEVLAIVIREHRDHIGAPHAPAAALFKAVREGRDDARSQAGA